MVAERQFGPYRLVRQIAVGGMAELHLAKTKGIAGFEKYCALKMIHPNFAEDEQFIQMLVDEAKIAVELTHGNIAQTFDLGHVGDTYYITMEYVDGADLYKVLRRASEQELEIPLDMCAFIAKEIASALDYAHRKRDHAGKPLGIVHRDVSPQNVLISYAGEVKLVDFGIAKATMKARQTAVGVIKGKYYYMSPEQAWGERIDHRSDIFSAGIVLYEMITGQMLYLEEDLHKLLEMVRKADIAPPSRLRRGVPPQLERIVMHALGKGREERYQSASDLASDLERFLHTYAPVFTAGKVANLMRQVVGEPTQVPAEEVYPSIEMRDGPSSTHPLDISDLVHEREEIRDENSVIFRVADLKQQAQQQTPAARAGGGTPPAGQPRPPTAATPPKGQPRPAGTAPRTTRAADPLPSVRQPTEPEPEPTLPRASSGVPRPRLRDEETRPVQGMAPPDASRTDDSGLLSPQGRKIDPASWDSTATIPGLDADAGDLGDLDNIGERTMVTGGSGGGFMMDVAMEDGVDATLVNAQPPLPPGQSGEDEATDVGDADDDGDEGQTITRSAPRVQGVKAPPPAALAAKIHAPAVSELRKPRPSRRTPPGGVPAATPPPNVLQRIVSSQASEPMPVPRSPLPTPPAMPAMDAQPPVQPPGPPSSGGPAGQVQYVHDASGLPMAVPTPPAGLPAYVPPNPAQLYPGQNMAGQGMGVPGGYPPGYPPQPYPQAQPPYAVSPGGLYQMSPYGQPPPMPVTLTSQLRLSEVDEIPSHFKINSARRRWIAYIAAGIMAVSVAAASTFFIIRATRDSTPPSGTIEITSVPPGGTIVFNGTALTEATPFTIRDVPPGSTHEIRVEKPFHKPYTQSVSISANGGTVGVTAVLQQITGKIIVDSQPGGAEIWLDGQLRGRTPTTLNDIDMATTKKLELRLKDYQPFVSELKWPPNGQLSFAPKLVR